MTGWVKPYDFVFTWAQPLGVFWLVLMTGVNYLGVRLGGGVQVFLTAIKLFGVLMVIGVAFALPASGAHMPGPMWPVAGRTGVLGAFLAGVGGGLLGFGGGGGFELVRSGRVESRRH